MASLLRDQAAHVREAAQNLERLQAGHEPLWHRHENRRDDAALVRIANAVEAQRAADAEFQAAVLAARRGGSSLRKIAAYLGVPHTTLADRLRRLG